MKAKIVFLIALFCLPACVFAQTGNSGLDPSFANGGILIDTQENFFRVCDIAVQPDGKIVVAGADYVARYLSNGKPDSTFGNTGFIAVNKLTDSNGGYASHVFLVQDGKILLTIGQSKLGEMAVRLMPNGSFDSSFGSAGRIIFCCGVLQAALQPDGKLVTAGIENNDYVAVHRITREGRIDSIFGVNGKRRVYVSSGGRVAVAGLGIATDGHIGVVGDNYRNVYYFRLDSNGTRDSSHCGNGLCFGFGTLYCRNAIVYSDGRVLVAVSGLGDNSGFLARLKADVTPDSSFGPAGNGFLAVPGLRTIKLFQMPDGRIICAGMWNEHFAIARLLKDGKGKDTTFGDKGIITTNVAGAHSERIHAIALQPDGKIVAGGISFVQESDPRYWHIAPGIVRYLPNAPLGINETRQSVRRTLNAFPNPAKTSLTIVVPASGLLQLVTIEGRLLRQLYCARSAEHLDVTWLPQGPYLLLLQTAEGRYSSLFMKE